MYLLNLNLNISVVFRQQQWNKSPLLSTDLNLTCRSSVQKRIRKYWLLFYWLPYGYFLLQTLYLSGVAIRFYCQLDPQLRKTTFSSMTLKLAKAYKKEDYFLTQYFYFFSSFWIWPNRKLKTQRQKLSEKFCNLASRWKRFYFGAWKK